MEFRSNNVPRRMNEPLAQLGASNIVRWGNGNGKSRAESGEITISCRRLEVKYHLKTTLICDRPLTGFHHPAIRCPVTPSILTALFLVARRQR